MLSGGEGGKLAEDMLFLRWYFKMLKRLGVIMYSTMPITFLLAFRSSLAAANMFISITYCVALVLQRFLWQSFDGWARTRAFADVDMPYLDEAPDKFKSWSLSVTINPCAAILLVAQHVAVFLLDSIEIIDPDMDVMSAGASFHMLPGDQVILFKKSWHNIFIVGRVVELLGLSDILFAGMFVITVIQLRSFLYWANAAEESLGYLGEDDYNWWLLFAQIGMMADASGLLMLKSGLKPIWVTSEKYPYERTSTFGPKSILETGFNAWFQITLLAITVDTVTWFQLASVAFSIVSSFIAAGMGWWQCSPRCATGIGKVAVHP